MRIQAAVRPKEVQLISGETATLIVEETFGWLLPLGQFLTRRTRKRKNRDITGAHRRKGERKLSRRKSRRNPFRRSDARLGKCCRTLSPERPNRPSTFGAAPRAASQRENRSPKRRRQQPIVPSQPGFSTHGETVTLHVKYKYHFSLPANFHDRQVHIRNQQRKTGILLQNVNTCKQSRIKKRSWMIKR